MANNVKTKNPAKTAVKNVRTQLSVDFPRQYETIDSAEYTLRISAPEAVQKVEVTVDQGDWQACRPAAGYWWFDWKGYENGEHEITTRILTAEGRVVASEPHEFFVKLAKVPASV